MTTHILPAVLWDMNYYNFHITNGDPTALPRSLRRYMAELRFNPTESGSRAQVPNCSQALAGITFTWGLGITTKAQVLSCFNRHDPLCPLLCGTKVWEPLHCALLPRFWIFFRCYCPSRECVPIPTSVSWLVPSGGETAREPSRDPLGGCPTPCLALETPQLLSLVTRPSLQLSKESLWKLPFPHYLRLNSFSVLS